MNSNILEKSLAAQKLVFNQSRDPVQKPGSSQELKY